MNGSYAKDLVALVVLVGALIVLTFLFGDVPRALNYAFERTSGQAMAAQAAGACEASGVVSGSSVVTLSAGVHQACKPAGPPSNGGRDGYVCFVPVPGGVVEGLCAAGCCTGPYAYPEAPGFLSGLGEGLLQGVILGGANQLLGSLLGGGGSGSGDYGSGAYYPNAGGAYTPNLQYDSFDNFNDSSQLAWDVEDEYEPGFSLGSDSSDSGNGPLSGGSNTSGDSVNPQPQQTTRRQPADSVSTTYEYLRDLVSGRSSSSNGEGLSSSGQIEADSRLSLAELEQNAADAQRREAALNEQRATDDLSDYRSSGVAQSGGQVNPLATGERTAEGGALSWWERFVLFLGQLFGSNGS